jgi:hypothetical protein
MYCFIATEGCQGHAVSVPQSSICWATKYCYTTATPSLVPDNCYRYTTALLLQGTSYLLIICPSSSFPTRPFPLALLLAASLKVGPQT